MVFTKSSTEWICGLVSLAVAVGSWAIYTYYSQPRKPQSKPLGWYTSSIRRRLSRSKYKSIFVEPWKFRPGWIPSQSENKVAYLSHTSFTLYSYFELPSFSSISHVIFDDIVQAKGYIGHSSAASLWTKTLDTMSVWESVEDMRAFGRSKKHGEAVQKLYTGQQFSNVPRMHMERFECRTCVLESCFLNAGDYETTLLFWERVLNIHDNGDNDSEIVRMVMT